MSFTSEIYSNEPLISDVSDESLHQVPSDQSTGLDLAPRGPGPYEYGAAADPFPSELLIPQSEWQSRIQEMEANKSRISDLIRQANLPPKNQQSTNYCWVNAPVHALEVIRLQQNEPTVILSPASVGAQITNYRNVGGWGKEALQFISDHGVVPVDQWPANAISKQYATEANLALAGNYRVTDWIELAPRNLQQLVSMLLRRIPVPVAFNWWGHEVLACDPVWINGQVGIRIRNSWGNWGDFGFAVLQGNKRLPDDAVAPRVALPA